MCVNTKTINVNGFSLYLLILYFTFKFKLIFLYIDCLFSCISLESFK